MTVTTRFAPSPTGRIHVGNIKTALHSWLWAKKHGGKFILRLDDTDVERSSEEFAQAIRDDLAWLALVPDEEQRQSQRGVDQERAARARRCGIGHAPRVRRDSTTARGR